MLKSVKIQAIQEDHIGLDSPDWPHRCGTRAALVRFRQSSGLCETPSSFNFLFTKPLYNMII